MRYDPPVSQILLAMRSAGALHPGWSSALPEDDRDAIISEAGRFASERIAPLNRVGDLNPASLSKGEVVTPPGWRDTYKEWRAGGWNSLTGPAEFGGQELPMSLTAACTELWNSSCMAFALCPLLTSGAIEAIAAHGSDSLKQQYLPKLISGEWSGTMNLTEPQAGSDLSNLRCQAQRSTDGSYRIKGSKIYITYGEHDCTSNIVHLVLARLADAPPGSRGISLFLVPKYLPGGERNDVRCHSLEHKLGIKGSPTCTMIYGDDGGATGWLVGEENRGLACMFTMMNNARLLVGVQGVALAERATQAALNFARERRQGRSPASGQETAAIIDHPDVKRMLIEMRAKTAAARVLCMATASAIDASKGAASENERHHAQLCAALFTPMAKAYATDVAVEVTTLAIQVHGGMGFIEETGVAQYYRDARILPIYEGTNGIQAIDLVARKLTPEAVPALMDTLNRCRSLVARIFSDRRGEDRISEAGELAETVAGMTHNEEILAVATPLLRAIAVAVAAGYLAEAAEMARGTALEAEAFTSARYILEVELTTVVAAAKAALSTAGMVVAADLT